MYSAVELVDLRIELIVTRYSLAKVHVYSVIQGDNTHQCTEVKCDTIRARSQQRSTRSKVKV